MSVDEALGVLGISHAATKEQIRRAYLRGVKAHPPERDADGFQQVREAYELLSSMQSLRSRLSPMAEREPSPLSDRAPDAASSEALELPAATFDPPYAPTTTPSIPDEQERWLERERILHAVDEEDWKAAADALHGFYRRAPRPDAPYPNPATTLRVVLGLYSDRKPNRAGKLLDALDTFTRANASWAGRMQPHEAARWTVVRELAELHGSVSDELVEALADAIIEDDYVDAGHALVDWTDAHGSMAVFRSLAPTLYGILSHYVPARQFDPQRFRPTGRGSWILRGLGLMLTLRLCAGLASSSTDTPPVPVLYSPPSPGSHPVLSREDQTMRSERRIEDAIRLGDCAEVRDSFPLYATLGGTSPSSVASLRKRAVAMCPELDGSLPR